MFRCIMVTLILLSLTAVGCRSEAPEDALRVTVLTIGEPDRNVIGPVINADTLREAIDRLESDDPDVIVLHINSPGGMVSAVPPLSELIRHELEQEYRVVAWVQRAASAAALVTLTCDEIVMMPEAILGGVVTYEADPDGRLTPITHDEANVMWQVGERVAELGGYDPAILHAMQEPTGLSRSGDDWQPDASGDVVVCPEGEILVFNAVTAEQAGVSLGVAPELADLMRVLEIENWRLVGEEAETWLAAAHASAGAALVRASTLHQADRADDRAELAEIFEAHPWIGRYLGQPPAE